MRHRPAGYPEAVRAGPVIPFPAASAPLRRTALPRARGPVTGILLEVLRCPPGMPVELPLLDPSPELLADDDVQLALYLCYELHCGELEGVDDRWEWDPGLLAFRAVLERAFEASLCEAVPPPQSATPAEVVGTALHALVAAEDDPALARFVETRATREQVRELLVHRSARQSREADPHSWALPRLNAAPALELDPRCGADLERLPGCTLASVNLMSMCGLHRRLRGALVGQLAASEITASLPNRRYAAGLRRLGYGDDATGFFDERAEANAVHEQAATWDLAGSLAAAEPALAGDVLWGAAALLDLEARWAEHLLDAWGNGESSLLSPRSA